MAMTRNKISWEQNLDQLLKNSSAIAENNKTFSDNLYVLSQNWICNDLEDCEPFEEMKKVVYENCVMYIKEILPLFKGVVVDVIETFIVYNLPYKRWNDNFNEIIQTTKAYEESAKKCHVASAKFIQRMNDRRDDVKRLICLLKPKDKINQSMFPQFISNFFKEYSNSKPPFVVSVMKKLEKTLSQSLSSIKLICEFLVDYYKEICSIDTNKKWKFHEAMRAGSGDIMATCRNILSTFTSMDISILSIQLKKQKEAANNNKFDDEFDIIDNNVDDIGVNKTEENKRRSKENQRTRLNKGQVDTQPYNDYYNTNFALIYFSIIKPFVQFTDS